MESWSDKGKGRYVTEDASPALTARRIPTEIKRVPSVRTPKAAELFANDDHLTDEGSQDNEDTDATQPPSSSSYESGRSWENIEESDTERRNTRKREPLLAACNPETLTVILSSVQSR